MPTKKPAHEVLYQAMARPTDTNVRAALEHADLKDALDGLTPADFKKLSDVLGKLDRNDQSAVNKVLSTPKARTVC